MSKKILLSVTLILLLSVSAFAESDPFARAEVKLPEISDQLSKLENVTGWTKLPEGQWLDKKDRIPRYLSVSSTLQNFEKYRLGIDNFQLLELRELKYDVKDYYILYKHYTDGSYKYKNIEKGWSYWYYVDAYVFEKENLPVIELSNKETQLFEIEVVSRSYELYFSRAYGKQYIKDISEKIPASIEEDPLTDKKIIINAIKLDDKIRFLLLENTYMYGLKGRLPISQNEVLTDEVFKNFYYEIDLVEFENFWNIK